jgi:hypothetical protein
LPYIVMSAAITAPHDGMLRPTATTTDFIVFISK